MQNYYSDYINNNYNNKNNFIKTPADYYGQNINLVEMSPFTNE